MSIEFKRNDAKLEKSLNSSKENSNIFTEDVSVAHRIMPVSFFGNPKSNNYTPASRDAHIKS